jgi:rRNA maturation endonuclease Nob1
MGLLAETLLSRGLVFSGKCIIGALLLMALPQNNNKQARYPGERGAKQVEDADHVFNRQWDAYIAEHDAWVEPSTVVSETAEGANHSTLSTHLYKMGVAKLSTELIGIINSALDKRGSIADNITDTRSLLVLMRKIDGKNKEIQCLNVVLTADINDFGVLLSSINSELEEILGRY